MSIITWTHVVAGGIAVATGGMAMVATKGSRWHRRTGLLFGVTMLTTALCGCLLALVRGQAITMLAGLLASYLVLTGWLSLQPSRRKVLVSEAVLGATAVGTAGGCMALGYFALNDTAGTWQGFPAEDYFYLGGIALLAAFGDVYRLAVGRYAGKPRIARHLWRMSTGLFFAVGSLFTGPGATVFSPALRDSGVLMVPELAVLALMVFWLVRVARRQPR